MIKDILCKTDKNDVVDIGRNKKDFQRNNKSLFSFRHIQTKFTKAQSYISFTVPKYFK